MNSQDEMMQQKKWICCQRWQWKIINWSNRHFYFLYQLTSFVHLIQCTLCFLEWCAGCCTIKYQIFFSGSHIGLAQSFEWKIPIIVFTPTKRIKRAWQMEGNWIGEKRLYSGPVVLHGVLSPSSWKHFLIFSFR